MTFCKTIKTQFKNIKNSAAIQKINQIIYSPWSIGVLGLLAFLAFAFSLEAAFYTVVAIYTIFVGLFADDLAPIMPLFVICYVTPSINNNPGLSNEGLFFGSTAIYLVCIVSVAVSVLLLRIAIDKDFGLKRLVTTKRTLLWGILGLGLAYLLSGITHERYLENATKNLLFAFIQFASIFFLYFILSGAVKWDQFNPDYFAWAGLIMGFVVSAEIIFLYCTHNVIVDGIIYRSNIYTGWGCYNNVGAIISMSIPFAFYFAARKKRSSIFLIIGCLLFVMVILSCSRGSMVGAAFAFVTSLIYTFFKCNNKKEFRTATIALLGIITVSALIFHKPLELIFSHVPEIGSVDETGALVVNDSGRLDIYLNGLKTFLRNPIFGQSFYSVEFELFSFSYSEQFNSFFPPRWHNTIIQILASCGAVGMLAYAYHRFDTIRLYFKKRTLTNTYILLFIITLLVMSLLDCHFFNVGPVLFYSIALAVMEFGKEKQK